MNDDYEMHSFQEAMLKETDNYKSKENTYYSAKLMFREIALFAGVDIKLSRLFPIVVLVRASLPFVARAIERKSFKLEIDGIIFLLLDLLGLGPLLMLNYLFVHIGNLDFKRRL